jgi:hypothetical protein
MKRQYIGVTSNGRRFLLMSLVFFDKSNGSVVLSPSEDWKLNWIEIDDAGETFVYDIAAGTFTEADY